MLLSLFGTPSMLSYATAHIVRRMSDVLFGAHDYLSLPAQIEAAVTGDAAANAAQPTVVFTDLPSRPLVAGLKARKCPVVLVVDDFSTVVAHLMRARDMTFVPAVRLATQAVALLDAIRDGDCHRVSALDQAHTLGAFVETLAHAYDLTCTPAQLTAIVTSLWSETVPGDTLGDFVGALRRDDRTEDPVLTEHDARDLAALAAGYDALGQGRTPNNIDWPTRLALRWGDAPTPLDGPVDLIGPARFIICGPYLHLPQGHWRMRVEIEVRDCLSDNRIGADIFSETILAAVTARLPAEGRHTFPLEFRVTNAAAPVEIRLQVVNGCIEGSLALLDLSIEPMSGANA